MRYVGLPILALAACISEQLPAVDTAPGDPPNELYGPRVLEEIYVTAQKRGEENLLDVAMSVAAIEGEELSRRHILGMDDYLRYQPGTNFIERGAGRNSVIIRGITSDPGRGGVITGVYIDEIPVHGIGLFETGSPDLATVDIERVEVLRGPQGTLYGAGSMSGTVRTLTREPDPQALDGFVMLGGGSTSGYGGTNNEIQAMLNVPLSKDSLALRAVAYRIDNSGYIKNVAGTDPAKLAAVDAFGARISDLVSDRGATVTEGYRFGVLWHANDRLDLRFTALGQRTEQEGVPTIDVLQGPYEQSRFERLDGTDESMYDDLDLYALTVEYTADNWSLTSASAWIENVAAIDWDVGLFFLDALEGVEAPMFLFQADVNDVFTQEVRWRWDSGGRWQFLVGAHYEDRTGEFIQANHIEAESDPFEGFFETDERFPLVGALSRFSLFSDVTFGLTERLEATAGIRTYDIEERESSETYKAGFNWRPGTDALGRNALIYALWGEGYRPGFPVLDPPGRCDPNGDGIIDEVGLPWQQVDFDDLSSFEVGYKSSFAKDRVAVEAATFKIDWTGIRIDLPVGGDCAYTLPFNAGAAESKGFEFSMSALLADSLQLDFSASWMSAELAKDGLLGPAGSRLPGSPDFNASLALQYQFKAGARPAWVRADAFYVGDYYDTLAETPPKLGDYATLNLAGGLDLDRYSVELYILNLFDSDALTWANPIWAPYDRESRLRPRTAGIRIGFSFGDNQPGY